MFNLRTFILGKRKSSVDYKHELELSAKNMILIHDPSVLNKMIVRMIVQKLKVKHATILLGDKNNETYTVAISRSEKRIRPTYEFVQIDCGNPLIRFFKGHWNKRFFKDGLIVYERIVSLLRRNAEIEGRGLLKDVANQMERFNAAVCIPGYFEHELLGILLLGNKSNRQRFLQEELDFFVALASYVTMAIRNAQLFSGFQQELEKNKKLFINIIIALATAIDAKDHYIHGHTARVTEYSLLIAKKLMVSESKKIDDKFLEEIHIAGLLHDIGKIGIPESILNKEGALDIEERKKMQEHPLVGVTILQPIQEFENSILGVKYHHERYDGLGYPEGLKGDQIPVIASIISVADAFDAMITDRPYRPALKREEAIEQLKVNSHSQFDPRVASSLIELCREGKI
jgi:HD-GYP domain-containing protein (c-di-GMP phosphodiesterase class II)